MVLLYLSNTQKNFFIHIQKNIVYSWNSLLGRSLTDIAHDWSIFVAEYESNPSNLQRSYTITSADRTAVPQIEQISFHFGPKTRRKRKSWLKFGLEDYGFELSFLLDTFIFLLFHRRLKSALVGLRKFSSFLCYKRHVVCKQTAGGAIRKLNNFFVVSTIWGKDGTSVKGDRSLRAKSWLKMRF